MDGGHMVIKITVREHDPPSYEGTLYVKKNFWKILSMGLSPLLDPKNPYIRGDTGGGTPYPHHIGGYTGGMTIILGVPPYAIALSRRYNR